MFVSFGKIRKDEFMSQGLLIDFPRLISKHSIWTPTVVHRVLVFPERELLSSSLWGSSSLSLLYYFITQGHSFSQLNISDSLEKTLMLGKIEGKRRRGWKRMRCLDSITDSMDMNLSKLRDTVKDREAWCVAVHGVTKSQKRLCDWTTTTATSPNQNVSHYHCQPGDCQDMVVWNLLLTFDKM